MSKATVQGIELAWQDLEGTCTFQGLPVAMMWVDSTLAGLMSGTAAMVGPERFSLALQSEGRKSVEADWLLISRYPEFRDGFDVIGVVAAVAGWGKWQLVGEDPNQRECRFRAYNTWEGLYQRKLGVCWGSAMLAGKFAGYCTRLFGANCWATQTAFIAKGDPCDEFVVAPSPLVVEDEIARLLSTDAATRADLAISLRHLREVQAQLLVNQETLEQQVRLRTSELAASRDQLQKVNDRLRAEASGHLRTDAARRQSEQRLRATIDLAPISMALVRMDGVIEYINRKAVETFGYTQEDIPTMEQWWVLAYPDPVYRREVIDRWTGHVTVAITEHRDIARDNYRVTCKDGTAKTVAIFGAPLDDKVLVVFDDITTQAFQEDQQRRSHAELERRVHERTVELADRNRRLQSEIVEREHAEARWQQANRTLEHTMSQLRRLGAKLARVEEQERKRMAHILHDQLQQSLVAASFSLAALERGVSETALRDTVLAARTAVEESLRESKSLILELSPPVLRAEGIAPAITWLGARMLEKHGLTVHVEVDGRVAVLEEDVRLAIFHGVRELLLNTVKHSGVSVASVKVSIDPDATLRIVVSDEGRGFKAPAADPHDHADLGFGLLAVHERFEALGGHMALDSAPGRGCRVTLTAPLAAPPFALRTLYDDIDAHAQVGALGTTDSRTPSSTARIRVLLVDDHVILRQGLMQLLSQDSGVEVVGEAADGEAAIVQAKALHPDVVLMDIGMPKMDGLEATRLIHAEFPEMVVIGLSMHSQADRGDAMLKAGAAAYVSKSEASEVLVATIHVCCGR